MGRESCDSPDRGVNSKRAPRSLPNERNVTGNQFGYAPALGWHSRTEAHKGPQGAVKEMVVVEVDERLRGWGGGGK